MGFKERAPFRPAEDDAQGLSSSLLRVTGILLASAFLSGLLNCTLSQLSVITHPQLVTTLALTRGDERGHEICRRFAGNLSRFHDVVQVCSTIQLDSCA